MPTIESFRECRLPDIKSLRRTQHLTVADACRTLDASKRELLQDGEPALEQEMTRLAAELCRRPCIEACNEAQG